MAVDIAALDILTDVDGSFRFYISLNQQALARAVTHTPVHHHRPQGGFVCQVSPLAPTESPKLCLSGGNKAEKMYYHKCFF